MLYNNILETIGHTPMIRLNRIGKEFACTIWAKCEFFNPGGSVKDRIAYRMVLEAEKSGRIKKGDTLIEATSGNTGIGIALAGAVLGYKVIITMSSKMSREKEVILEALGAKIIRTPAEASFDSPDSLFGVAKKLQKEIPNSHILDQYKNRDNPMAHAETTAVEILEDLKGQVDAVVMGAGTGGTIAGVADRLKKENPRIQIVGADPEGSILAGPAEVKPYAVEGIGYDFIPEVMKDAKVDKWIKTNDRDSFRLARRLIREEGILCGGSTGSALQAAFAYAPALKKGQNMVVLVPDGVRNYMTKFLEPEWLKKNRLEEAL